VATVAGLLSITGLIVIVQYLPRPLLSTQDSTLRADAAPAALPLPDKPSIVVLPFVNMSEDPGQEYFSDGLTEDLTSDLSQISSLFVIARHSAFTYKGKAIKVQDVSREMGVRYVLEGSVRKANDQIRVTAQLIDGTTGGHLWSERYDRPLTDIFALQDEIRQKIVIALKVKLTPEEQERFRRAPTTNLEAYSYYLRGQEYFFRFTKETILRARKMFERAIELDPQYAAAYARLGGTYRREWIGGWNQDPQALDRAFEFAQQAVTLDDSLALAHSVLGLVYQWKGQYNQAIAEGERAVTLAPNNAESYIWLAGILGPAGRAEEGIEVAKKAMRLNPHAPPDYICALGFAYHTAWQNEEAIATFKRCLLFNPDQMNAHLGLTCSYSDVGRYEEARMQAAELLRVSPNFSTERWRKMAWFRDPTELKRHMDNLRKAGLK
jgi:adenylate cyclase